MITDPKKYSEDEKMEILTRVLLKHGKEIFNTPGVITDQDRKIQNLLNQTIFVRKTKHSYTRWLPMAALLLIAINVTLFYTPHSLRGNETAQRKGMNIDTLPFESSLQDELVSFAQEGAMYSNEPVLTQPGSEGEEMLVRVSADPFSKTFKTRRKTIPWEDLGLSPLDRGKRTQFYFCKPDKQKPTAEAHSWYVLSSIQAARLQSMVVQSKGDLEKARIFYKYFCYSEALHFASLAFEKDQRSLESLCLIRDCSQKLGYRKDEAEIEKMILKLKNLKQETLKKKEK